MLWCLIGMGTMRVRMTQSPMSNTSNKSELSSQAQRCVCMSACMLVSVRSCLMPHAAVQVFASTFDNFTQNVMQYKDSLPVYTQEFGDTWIYVRVHGCMCASVHVCMCVCMCIGIDGLRAGGAQ